MKRTIIITGGNTGLGYSCAGYIAGSSNDYTIMIACRNVQKGNNAAEKLKEKTGNAEFYNSQLCAQQRAINLTGVNPVCEGLANQQ